MLSGRVQSRYTVGSTLTYIWLLDGQAVSGETAVTYTISSWASENTGIYTCIAQANGINSTLSSSVEIAPTGKLLSIQSKMFKVLEDLN